MIPDAVRYAIRAEYDNAKFAAAAIRDKAIAEAHRAYMQAVDVADMVAVSRTKEETEKAVS